MKSRIFWYRRPSRSVPSLLVSLILVVLGALVLWAGIARLRNGHWEGAAENVESWVSGLTWGDTAVLIVAVILVILAVLLTIVVIIPGRRSGQLVQPRLGEGAEEMVTHAAVGALVESRVNRVDGVRTSRASVRDGLVSVLVQSPLRDKGPLRLAVGQAANAALSGLPLEQVPRVSVRIRVEGGE